MMQDPQSWSQSPPGLRLLCQLWHHCENMALQYESCKMFIGFILPELAIGVLMYRKQEVVIKQRHCQAACTAI